MRKNPAIKLLALSILAVCVLLLFAGTALAAGGPRAVTVDASKTVGALRSLQGAHFDPGPAGETLSDNYVALGVDSIRTHDAGGFGTGNMGIGDIDGYQGVAALVIFPNWNADPNDPKSYNFGPTDQLIKNIRAIGAEVFFRVGRSNIVSFGGGYPFVDNYVPADMAKYGEIVKHVVMHYNKGWANGYHYGIRWWEIWNEPDLLPFWAANDDPAQYQELYKQVSRAIKSVYPQAKIGGPANTTHNDLAGLEDSFLKFVAANRLPLDFYSFHLYANHTVDPYDNVRYAQRYREMLNKYGFKRTQIVDSEYGTALDGTPMIGEPAGTAVFNGEVQMYMQDAPVARVYSYAEIGTDLTKTNYAYEAVGKLKATPQRLWTQGGDTTGFAVLAGRNEGKRTLQVLIANYEISADNMGPLNLPAYPGGPPIPGNNTEQIAIPGLGILGTWTWLERGTITYKNTEGYNLQIRNIPLGWGDLKVEQYRLDNDNNLKLVASWTVKKSDRGQAPLPVSGSWVHSAPGPHDPVGVAQGMDLIVVKGSTGSAK
jgi:xylan 1,4-beta-xylosidase